MLVDNSTDIPTTGRITSHQVSPFATTSLHGELAPNGDLNVTVLASRKLQIEAEVTTGHGETTHVVWQQNLQYENLQIYLLNATQQAGPHFPIRHLTPNSCDVCSDIDRQPDK